MSVKRVKYFSQLTQLIHIHTNGYPKLVMFTNSGKRVLFQETEIRAKEVINLWGENTNRVGVPHCFDDLPTSVGDGHNRGHEYQYQQCEGICGGCRPVQHTQLCVSVVHNLIRKKMI